MKTTRKSVSLFLFVVMIFGTYATAFAMENDAAFVSSPDIQLNEYEFIQELAEESTSELAATRI
jgi:hypothetical protein